jgi:PKD repeat protein
MKKIHKWSLFKRNSYLKVFISALILLCMVSAVQAVPVADFTGNPTSGNIPLLVQFTDTSTPYGNITAWEWFFGDGSGSTIRDPMAIYLFPGTFNVTLTVMDNEGLVSTPATKVIQANAPPSPTLFDVNNTSSSLLTVNRFFGIADPATHTFRADFTAFADGVTEDTKFKWNFGDGTTETTTDPQVSHEYPEPDDNTPDFYSVCVKVKNNAIGDDYTICLPMNITVVRADQQQIPFSFTGQYWVSFSEEV